MKRHIVLVYNLMWDQRLDFDQIDLPTDFLFTTNRCYLNSADAVLFHMPSLELAEEIEKQDDQLWIYWSMECELHYPALRQRELLELFDLQMTYRQDADIWIPYILPEHKSTLRHEPATKAGLLNAFVSSRYNQSKREEQLSEIMSLLPVDSYGRLFNNKNIPIDKGVQTKRDIISTYKFTIAFENAIARDYVTEKFFEPLIAGSVPVYLGAPNISEFAPAENCYIDVSTFASTRSLADYLNQLNNDESLYQKYLDWKKKPFLKFFEQKLEMIQEHPFSRLCKLIRKRKS